MVRFSPICRSNDGWARGHKVGVSNHAPKDGVGSFLLPRICVYAVRYNKLGRETRSLPQLLQDEN